MTLAKPLAQFADLDFFGFFLHRTLALFGLAKSCCLHSVSVLPCLMSLLHDFIGSGRCALANGSRCLRAPTQEFERLVVVKITTQSCVVRFLVSITVCLGWRSTTVSMLSFCEALRSRFFVSVLESLGSMLHVACNTLPKLTFGTCSC
jgi:hypothetical protein